MSNDRVRVVSSVCPFGRARFCRLLQREFFALAGLDRFDAVFCEKVLQGFGIVSFGSRTLLNQEFLSFLDF